MQTQEAPSVPVARKEEVIYMINYLYLTSSGAARASQGSSHNSLRVGVRARSSTVRHRGSLPSKAL